MKTNYLLLSMVSLFLLWPGCSSLDGDITPNVPDETPSDSSSLEGDNCTNSCIILETVPVIWIEYFDKEGVGFRLLSEISGLEAYLAYTHEFMTVEVVSLIDELTGQSYLSNLRYKEGIIDSVLRDRFSFGVEFFECDAPEATRHYELKYKVPSFKGESVEEIKGIYHHQGGLKGSFTEVLYNGKAIPIIDHDEIKAYYTNPDKSINTDRYITIIKETHYSGNPVAIRSVGTQIYLVLPYEKP